MTAGEHRETLGWKIADSSTSGSWLIVCRVLCYTFGVIFFVWDRQPFNHALWHLFVPAGNAFHVCAVLYYVIPPSTA